MVRPHPVVERNGDGHPPLRLTHEQRRVVRISQPDGLDTQLTCPADPAVVPDHQLRHRPPGLHRLLQHRPDRKRRVGVRAGRTPGGPHARFAHQRDTLYVVEAVRAYAESSRHVDTSALRRGEHHAAGRRQRVRQPRVEPEKPMRMPRAEQHRGPPLRSPREPPRERLQGGQGPLRVDHVRARHMTGVARDTTLVGHQPQQITLTPGAVGIKPEQYTGIPRREQPITPQTGLPRRGHGPREPRRQQMSAQRSGAQHPPDAPAPGAARGRNPHTAHPLA